MIVALDRVVLVHHRSRNWYQEALAEALMAYCDTPEHNQIKRATRVYCAYHRCVLTASTVDET
jgi:hypothetical protein